MSDSGRQIGDCPHGKVKEWCIDCLREENDKLKNQLRKDSNKLFLNQYSKEELLWMESGRLIDALVAENVMNYSLWEDSYGIHEAPKFSSEYNEAMKVFEKYKDCGWDLGWHRLRFERVDRVGWFIISWNDYNKKLTGLPIAFAETIPLVICRASLLVQYDKIQMRQIKK